MKEFEINENITRMWEPRSAKILVETPEGRSSLGNLQAWGCGFTASGWEQGHTADPSEHSSEKLLASQKDFAPWSYLINSFIDHKNTCIDHVKKVEAIAVPK
jgi:hypothetical protein